MSAARRSRLRIRPSALMRWAACALLAVPRAAPAQEPPASPAGELLAQAALGMGFAALGGIGLGFIGAQTIGPDGGEDPGLVGAVIGGAAGLSIGAASGVYLGASRTRPRGSFGASAIGGAVGLVTFVTVAPDPDHHPAVFLLELFGLPTVGATLAYHVTRSAASGSDGTPRGARMRVGPRIGPNGVGVGLSLRH